MRRTVLILVAVAAAVAAGSPAMAQQTARDLLREAMEQRGIYSGVDYGGRESPVSVPGPGQWQDWYGLQVSQGTAEGGGQTTYLAIVRNTSDASYCVRLGGIPFSPANDVTGRMEGNAVVDPGQHQVLMAAVTSADWSVTPAIAFWRPDMSLPYDQQCRGVAPTGVVEWSQSNTNVNFSGSRR